MIELSVTVHVGLRTCCADRRLNWLVSKNPIDEGDFHGFLPNTSFMRYLVHCGKINIASPFVCREYVGM